MVIGVTCRTVTQKVNLQWTGDRCPIQGEPITLIRSAPQKTWDKHRPDAPSWLREGFFLIYRYSLNRTVVHTGLGFPFPVFPGFFWLILGLNSDMSRALLLVFILDLFFCPPNPNFLFLNSLFLFGLK